MASFCRGPIYLSSAAFCVVAGSTWLRVWTIEWPVPLGKPLHVSIRHPEESKKICCCCLPHWALMEIIMRFFFTKDLRQLGLRHLGERETSETLNNCDIYTPPKLMLVIFFERINNLFCFVTRPYFYPFMLVCGKHSRVHWKTKGPITKSFFLVIIYFFLGPNSG